MEQNSIIASVEGILPKKPKITYKGYSSLDAGLHISLLNFMRFLPAHFSSVLRSLWTGTIWHTSHSSQFCINSQTWWGCTLSHHPGH